MRFNKVTMDNIKSFHSSSRKSIKFVHSLLNAGCVKLNVSFILQHLVDNIGMIACLQS